MAAFSARDDHELSLEVIEKRCFDTHPCTQGDAHAERGAAQASVVCTVLVTAVTTLLPRDHRDYREIIEIWGQGDTVS